MMAGHDFIILSTQDWEALPTRKQRFARWWAEAGNRVLYVEQQMHWLGWVVDVRRQYTRLWRWLKGPRRVASNLWVYTLPLVLPFFQMVGAINWINNLFLLPVLRVQLRQLGFAQPILWTYTPHSVDFIGRLGEQAAVYECVDDFTSAKGLVDPEAIQRMEQRLIEAVDLLIVTSDALLHSKQRAARRAVLIPNGVEADHFARTADSTLPVAETLAGLQHPVIGYLGTLNYWIDTDLLAQIAKAHPDWTLVHVGPRDLLARMAPLEGLPNFVSTGRVPYEELPRYIKAFDVCVNPYVRDGVAEHCSPLKLYEYIATGKPVVSVDMPEARKFKDLIHIAQDADHFLALVEQAVQTDDGLAERRLAEAQRHTWRSRFAAAASQLAEVLRERAL